MNSHPTPSTRRHPLPTASSIASMLWLLVRMALLMLLGGGQLAQAQAGAPVPSISSPVQGGRYSALNTAALISYAGVTTVDAGAKITKLEMYDNGKLIRQVVAATMPAFNLGAAIGKHRLELRATDSLKRVGSAFVEFEAIAGVAPTVQMVAPSAGQSFAITSGVTAPVTVVANANVFNEAKLTRFDVMEGTAVLASAPGGNMNAVLQLDLGEHLLHLRAVDSIGKTTLTTPVKIMVTAPAPTAEFTAPAPNSIALAPDKTATVELTGVATVDPAAAVATLEVYEGTVRKFYVRQSNPNLKANVAFPLGPHKLEFRVTDNRGMTGSAYTNFTVQQALPATVALTSPGNGSSYAITTSPTVAVPVVASARGAAGATIDKIEVIVGGVPRLTVAGDSVNDVVQLAYGAVPYSLWLRVTDSIGKVTLSEKISVTVTAPDPAPEITLPASGATYLTPTATASVIMNGVPNLAPGASLRTVEYWEGGKRIYLTPTAVPPANPITPTMNVGLSFAIGTHTVEARVTDSRLKKGSATTTFTVADAPPAVLAMSSPANGASFAITDGPKAGVPFRATARSVSSATIARIDVMEGARVVHTVKGDSLNEDVELPLGEHTLQLRAVDSVNKMTLGEEVAITVTAPAPEPSFAAPEPGSTFLAPTTTALVELEGLANLAPGAAVARLEFKEGATVIAVSVAASTTLKTKRAFAIGPHTVDFNVTDNRGKTASTQISFDVAAASPALVTLSAPLDGASYPVASGTTGPVQLVGSAAPVGGATIAKLEVLDNTSRVQHTALNVDKLDVTLNLGAGKHALQIRATDSVGKVALSPLATITMTVPPPLATLDAPEDGAKYYTAAATANVAISGSGTAYNGATIATIELLDGEKAIVLGNGPRFSQVKALPVGPHALRLRANNSVRQSGLSEVANITVVAATVGNDAQFVSQTVPATMRAGQPYNVVVKMRNTGTLPWQDGTGYRLGAQNPADSRSWVSTGRAHVSGVVATDQVATFTIPVTAPSKPGSYNFQWKMVKDGADWFGDSTENLTVVVAAGAGPSASLQVSPSNVRMVGSTPATLSFTGSGAEPGRKVVRLDLYRDAGDGYGAPVNTVSGATASLALNVKRNETGGVYRYKLRSTDDLGVSTDSEPVLVNVTDSPLLGMVKGVRIDAQNKPQLVGWMCQAGIGQALTYQVLLDAPTVATNGIVLTSGSANLGDEPDSADVEAQCGTPGGKHFFSVDLSAYTGEYSGRAIYVQAKPGPVPQAPAMRSAMRAQGARLAQAQAAAPAALATAGATAATAAAAADVPPAVMPCEDRTCTMPGSLRIALTTPGKNDKFLAPATVFMSAQLSGGEGPYDEVAFAVDGQWTAGAPDTVAGRYFASQKDLAARATPYLIQAKVRQGDMTIFSSHAAVTVNTAAVLTLTQNAPADGAKYNAGTPIQLRATVVDTESRVNSVKFYANDLMIASGVNSSGVWTASWPGAALGVYRVTARAFDGNGVPLAQSASAGVTLALNPGGDPGAPGNIDIPPPHLASLNAGSLPGALAVANDGSASYSMALAVPPGTAGMQPNLALNYSGNGGNGMLGLGWSLGGLSSIHRCGKTIAQDGVNGRIGFDLDDRLCLDGQRLVLVNLPQTDENYWADGAEYRTEIEGFGRITAQGAWPQRSFKLESKDGHIASYGGASGYVKAVKGTPNTADRARGNPEGPQPADKVGAQSWALDRIADRSGNYVSFAYEQNDGSGEGQTPASATGEHHIKTIRYGGNGLPAHAAVVFSYQDRKDVWKRYIDETRNDLRTRVSAINTYVGANLDGDVAATGSLVRTYTLDYETSPTSGRSLLNAVTACGPNAQTKTDDCLPATRFSWGKPDPAKNAEFRSLGNWPGAPLLTTWNNYGGIDLSADHADYFAFNDFDNDGFTDVLEKRVASADPGDMDTDNGRLREGGNPLPPGTMREVYRYFHNNGHGFVQYNYRIDTGEAFAVLETGDFNGDGAVDVLVGTPSGAKICLSPLRSSKVLGPENSTITFNCDASRPVVGENRSLSIPYVLDIVGDGRSAHYSQINTKGKATLCVQGSCVVDNDPPDTVLGHTYSNSYTPINTNQSYVAFTQMVDLGGVGKHYDVRWSDAYLLQVRDQDSTKMHMEWQMTQPTVFATGFRIPGSKTWPIRGYSYADYGPPCLALACRPYRFEQPSPSAGLSMDYSGSGYGGLVFGFLEYGAANGARIYTRAETTLCQSTGRALDCAVRQKYSGANYAAIRAAADFVGDGHPAILTESMNYQSPVMPRPTGNLQVCRVTGEDSTGGAGVADDNMNCVPWAGFTMPLEVGPTASADQVFFMDLLGTGRTQLVRYHRGAYVSPRNWQENGAWEVFEPVDVAREHEALDRIVQVSNGLGQSSTVEYVDGLPSGVVGLSGDSALAYPQHAMNTPGKVVQRLRAGNGAGAERSTAYRYYDGALDLAGRGALGFARIVSTDEQTGIATTSKYSQAWPFVGMLLSSEVVLKDVHLSDTSNVPQLQSFTHGNGAQTTMAFIESSETVRKDSNGSPMGSTTTVNKYTDGWGNINLQTITTRGGAEGEYKTEVSTTFRNDATRWLVGLPLSVVTSKTDPRSGTLVRTLARDYDADNGLQSSETREPDAPMYRLRTTFDRSNNRFGLVGKVTQDWIYPLPATAQSRVLSVTTYDGNGRFPATVANAMGHQESHRYDAGGGARLELVGPNGLATRWEVDGLGRLARELRADGNESRYYQRQCEAECPPATAMVRIVESFHGASRMAPPSLTYLDDAGRTLRTQSWGFDGKAVVADHRYDSMGRLYETDRPRQLGGDAYLESRVEYDELGRVKRVVKRDAPQVESESLSTYDGLNSVQTNARKFGRTELRNVIGQLVRTVDANGKATSFSYDPFGNLSGTVDPGGNVIEVRYDLLGRKIALDDPDLGLIEYEVDPLGQTRASVSPRQRAAKQRTGVEFDALGRMTARNEPDLDSYWVYDSAPMGVGRLAEANTVVAGQYDYRRQHGYDSLGRDNLTTLTLRDAVYTSRTEYDAWGRESRRTHQRGDAAAKAYDLRYGAYGQLGRVERAGLVLWELVAQDAAGRETEASWGNGLVRTHAYSPYSGLLDGGGLRTAAGGALLQEGYQYDALGNVTDRTQHWSDVGYAEHFVYDELNRLKSSEMQTPARPVRLFGYDDTGNLTAKPGAGGGVLHYPQSGKGVRRPHAVDSVGGLGSFEYDDNGNLTSGAGRTASWTSFDMPLRLAKGALTADFVYGPEHQRTRQDRGAGGQVTGSVVYAGAQEAESAGGAVTVKTYWPLGLGVEIDRPGRDTELNWIYRDHLGSPIALAGADGGRVEALDYDAWGKRRVPGDDATPDELDGKVDNRGYTGHEMLDQLDLVHMNGRVYDPLLARFLSADPLVQDPENGQSYNRYSYVLNNPTNLTDPSGFCSKGKSEVTGSAICYAMASAANAYERLNVSGSNLTQLTATDAGGNVVARAVTTASGMGAGATKGKGNLAARDADSANSEKGLLARASDFFSGANRETKCDSVGCIHQGTLEAKPVRSNTGDPVQDYINDRNSEVATTVANAGMRVAGWWKTATLFGMGGGAEGGAVAAERAAFTEISVLAKLTKNSANQWNVNLTQAKAIENLAANGFAKSLSKDGSVTIMSAGDKVYRFYPASTGGGMVGAPSGVPSASVSILDKIVTKLRFIGQ